MQLEQQIAWAYQQGKTVTELQSRHNQTAQQVKDAVIVSGISLRERDLPRHRDARLIIRIRRNALLNVRDGYEIAKFS